VWVLGLQGMGDELGSVDPRIGGFRQFIRQAVMVKNQHLCGKDNFQ
jgi:hypothetical protein